MTSNNNISELIKGGVWSINEDVGNRYLSKYLADIELIKSNSITIKELYSNRYALRKDAKKVSNSSNEKSQTTKTTRVINFEGVMLKNGGLCNYGMNDIAKELDIAYADNSINGVVLDIDTGGGDAQAAEILNKAVLRKNKPVVVLATNLMSGGAFGTANADYIIAAGETSRFGSVGVMASWRDATVAYEKAGVKQHTVYATKSVGKNKSFDDAENGDYEALVAELDEVNEIFHKLMISGRRLNKKGDWTDGRTFLAKAAIKQKLADEIGTLETAIEKVNIMTTEYEVVSVNHLAVATDKVTDETPTLSVAVEDALAASEDFKNQLAEKDLTIATEKENTNALTIELAELKTQLSELTEANNAAVANESALATENTELKSKLSLAKNANEAFQETINTLTTENAEMSAKLAEQTELANTIADANGVTAKTVVDANTVEETDGVEVEELTKEDRARLLVQKYH